MRDSSVFSSIRVVYPKNETIEVLHYNNVIARITTDWGNKVAKVVQLSRRNLFALPFPTLGDTFDVSMDLVFQYLQSRCFPPSREGVSEILKGMGLTNYNPLKIVKITHGILHEDYVWLRFEGEEGLCYEDVGIREVPKEWHRDEKGVDQ